MSNCVESSIKHVWRRAFNVGCTALITLALTQTASAVAPTIWQIGSERDVAKGDVENLSVADDGALTLAPELELVGETNEPLIWDMVEDAQGHVYIATGNDGKVFRLTDGAAPELVFDSPQSQVQSLVIDPQGNLYAGTAPDGIIYKIPPGGQAAVFSRTTETYIWDMEYRDGLIYAATGNSGRVLVIGQDGQVTRVALDSPDQHITQLISNGDGGFYAGTEGTGLVYVIDRTGDDRLLYQAPEREIHHMILGPDGRLYIAAVPGRQRTPPQPSSEGATEPGASVYRLEPSGAVTKLWTAPYPLILSMQTYDSSHILIGVGPRGVLYLLSTEGRVERIADTGESQPAVILKRNNGDILIGMSNSGRVKKLSTNRSMSGFFTTEVHDAGGISQWGRLEMIARTGPGSSIRIESRSGNREIPGREWSNWVPLGGDNSDMIASPPGQFLQLRATFNRSPVGETPRLNGLLVTQQHVNLRPSVGPVLVAPYASSTRSSSSRNQSDSNGNSDSERRTSSTSRTRQLMKRTLLAVRWGASDPNDDKLAFDLYYRQAGQDDWLELDRVDDKRSYVWDVEGTPEGLTEVKVVASDRPGNPWETTLTAEYISNPFRIDYSNPVVTLNGAEVRPDGSVLVRGTATDASGVLRRGEYSIDSDDWLVFFPEGEIFDSPQETIAFTTEVLEPGRHTLVVKVTDASGNVGSASLMVQAPVR